MLFTVGYQRHRALDTLTPVLLEAGVEVVVDVRARASSRGRADFNKAALGKGLATHGVAYLPLKELGNPDRTTDWAEESAAREAYRRILDESPEAQQALLLLAKLVPAAAVCLLCLEADAQECHRSVIAEALVEQVERLEVVHLA